MTELAKMTPIYWAVVMIKKITDQRIDTIY